MNTELRTNIFQIGETITGISGNFYYMEAPKKTDLPYSVFFFVTNPSSRDSVTKFETFFLQINIFDTDAENLELLTKRVREKFDDGEVLFNLPSFHVDRIDHQFSKPLKTDKVYQISMQYKLELSQK